MVEFDKIFQWLYFQLYWELGSNTSEFVIFMPRDMTYLKLQKIHDGHYHRYQILPPIFWKMSLNDSKKYLPQFFLILPQHFQGFLV